MDMTPLPLAQLVLNLVLRKETEGRSPKTTFWYREHLVRCRRCSAFTPPESTIQYDVAATREFVLHIEKVVHVHRPPYRHPFGDHCPR